MTSSGAPSANNFQGDSPAQQLNDLTTGDDDARKVDHDAPRYRSPIVRYLIDNCEEFAELSELRAEGWSNPEGDVYFQKLRKTSANATSRTDRHFYDLMMKIGKEIQDNTGALRAESASSKRPQILEIGVGRGGLLATALQSTHHGQAVGFSLPVPEGGYKVMLDPSTNPHLDIRYLDVTKLAADLGFDDIPGGHPEAEKFLPRQFEPGQMFDLVICSSLVVHTSSPDDRKYNEARRLMAAQLALGLERLNPGGKMVVLFRKVEAPHTALQLYKFNKFCDNLQLFKPTVGFASRSRFYMIATGVRSQDPEALRAVQNWKKIWKATTFDLEGSELKVLDEQEVSTDQILEEFGEDLVRLGQDVWATQAEALESLPFIEDRETDLF